MIIILWKSEHFVDINVVEFDPRENLTGWREWAGQIEACIRKKHLRHYFCIALNKNIWNLPKLTYCKNDHQFPYGLKFPNDTITSSSIEHLSMEDFNFDLNDLSNLFQCTPSLRYLNATIKSHSECKQMRIISIKLSFRNSLNSMINLFWKIP
jgi:hypothetical protein